MKAALVSGAALIGVSVFLKNWVMVAFVILLLIMAFVAYKQQHRRNK